VSGQHEGAILAAAHLIDLQSQACEPGAGDGLGEGIGTPSLAYAESTRGWELIDGLLGGRDAMIAAGERFMPKEERETPEDYRIRLDRNYLFPLFTLSLRQLASAPFERAVATSAPLPKVLTGFVESVDLRGTTMGGLAHTMFRDALARGRSFLFVDQPDQVAAFLAEAGEGRDLTAQPVTEGEKQALLQRVPRLGQPVWTHYRARDVIGIERNPWTAEIVGVRLCETRTHRDPETFAEVKIPVIRYVRTKTIEVWEWRRLQFEQAPQPNGQPSEPKSVDKWVMVSESENPHGFVPLVPLYLEDLGDDRTESPLIDLAEANRAHWAREGDYTNTLRYVSIPLLQAIGDLLGPDGEPDRGPVKLAAHSLYHFKAGAAGLSYVELEGRSIEAARTAIRDIEEHARTLGSQPFQAAAVERTATEVEVDEGRTQSSLEAWAQKLEQALTKALEYTLRLAEITPGEPIRVEVNKSFTLPGAAEAEGQHLLALLDRGAIRKATAVAATQRRGWLPEELDAETEVQLAQEELVRLGSMGPPLPDDDHDHEGEAEDDDEAA
jgi:hypothetical protein